MCTPLDRARAEGTDPPTLLLFAGSDLWRYGSFFYGGTLWSPAGVDADGFTFKLLLNGGRYSYTSGDLQGEVTGTLLSAAALPGWRFGGDDLTIRVFAGPVGQDYRLSPDDPGSRLHGAYIGAQFASEVWYQPTTTIMAAFNGAIATIGPTGSLRAAFGLRAFDAMFVGPESQMLWCENFQELQIGAHVTALRIDAAEWSAGGGWAMDSARRSGPYLRIGISAKY
jgi:hypothetical protein